MRRRARVSRSESNSPARVLLASGERGGDGAGSPSLLPPATTTTTTTTSKTFAVDAADATALVADLVVARADADLADVLATSLTVAIEVEESGAREAGGVGDGERTAVLCELVLLRGREALEMLHMLLLDAANPVLQEGPHGGGGARVSPID